MKDTGTYSNLENLVRFSPRYKNVKLQWLQDELFAIEKLGLEEKYLEAFDSGRVFKNTRNSSVAYVIGITNDKPTKYPDGLVVQKGKGASLPDIDQDFEQRFRERMINYTIDKYGTDRVAQVITFGKIKARTAVRDTARVLGYDPYVGDKISKLMPPLYSGIDTPLSACFEYDARYEQGYAAAEDLRELYATDDDCQKIIDNALSIEGLIKSSGIHAAGVVIGDQPLDNVVPLWKNADGVVATQWDKKVVESLGLVKMDYLGLVNLDIISDVQKMVPGLIVDNVPMDDPLTYATLCSGHTIGCFQVESSGMRSLLKRLRPSNINDLAALIALYRPGPMAQNWHIEYADRKNGRAPSTPFHEDAREILQSSYALS